MMAEDEEDEEDEEEEDNEEMAVRDEEAQAARYGGQNFDVGLQFTIYFIVVFMASMFYCLLYRCIYVSNT